MGWFYFDSGNKLNTTDTTRVSFDFRIISFDDWESYKWKESTITEIKNLSVLETIGVNYRKNILVTVDLDILVHKL